MARIKLTYYNIEQETTLCLYYSGVQENEQSHFLDVEFLRFGKRNYLYLSQFYSTSRHRILNGSKELILLQNLNSKADYTRQRKVVEVKNINYYSAKNYLTILFYRKDVYICKEKRVVSVTILK